MGKNKLLVIAKDAKGYERLLLPICEKNRIEALFLSNLEEKDIVELNLDKFDMLLADPYLVIPYLDKFSSLKWFQSTFAGVEDVVFYYKEKGLNDFPFQFTGIKDVFGDLISEYVIGYIIALHRNFFRYYENQKKKVWESIPYSSLEGKNIGLIGAGNIGGKIAERCFGLGMKVFAYTKSGRPVSKVHRVFNNGSLSQFLSLVDIVVSTLPLTDETQGLIDKEWFSKMKDGVIFINVGRGKTVVESDLIDALKSKKIGYAVLDVFEKEPLPKESPLWEMDNVFVTPHISGYSIPEKIVKVWNDNFLLFKKGKELKYQINLNKGY